MMNPKWLDFNAFLQEFSYKPNFAFKAFEKDGRPWLKITSYVEDSRKDFHAWDVSDMNEQMKYVGSLYNPFRRSMWVDAREVIVIEGNYIIPNYMPESVEAFKHFLIICIKKIEQHEMYEWLRYKGELIDDPHKHD